MVEPIRCQGRKICVGIIFGVIIHSSLLDVSFTSFRQMESLQLPDGFCTLFHLHAPILKILSKCCSKSHTCLIEADLTSSLAPVFLQTDKLVSSYLSFPLFITQLQHDDPFKQSPYMLVYWCQKHGASSSLLCIFKPECFNQTTNFNSGRRENVCAFFVNPITLQCLQFPLDSL